MDAKSWPYFTDEQKQHCEAHSSRSKIIEETKVSINAEY